VGEPGADVVEELCRAGVARGDLVGLAVAPRVGLGMATTTGKMSVASSIEDPSVVVRLVEDALRPRWVLWSNDTAATLLRAGVRIATCWDIAGVHRLLFGRWRADPASVWAQLQHLALGTIPTTAPADLFGDDGRGDGDPDDPIRPDGHLRPEWLDRGWCATPERLRRWAELAARVAVLQQARLGELGDGPRVASTARSESAAELLCVEMSLDGLPLSPRESSKDSSVGGPAARRRQQSNVPGATPRCCATRRLASRSTCEALGR
jgi:DNA polymerase-1